MPHRKFISYLRRTKHQDEPRLRKTIAIMLILIGIAGLFLPFIQGILLITAGYIVFTRKQWKNMILKHWDKWQKKKK